MNEKICYLNLEKENRHIIGAQRLWWPIRNSCVHLVHEERRWGWGCLDDLSTHEPTMWHFDLNEASTHPTNHLLWQFATVTFRLKVDGLSVHPKLWKSDLVNLDGLSQCDKSFHKVCDILSAFLSNFAVTFHPNKTKGLFFKKILTCLNHVLLTFVGKTTPEPNLTCGWLIYLSICLTTRNEGNLFGQYFEFIFRKTTDEDAWAFGAAFVAGFVYP